MPAALLLACALPASALPVSVDTLLDRGVLRRDAGRPGEAASAFAAAAELRPSDPDVWNALGETALQARDLDRAEAAFAKALAADPRHYYARLGLGRVLLERGDPSGAVVRFDSAVHSRPAAALPAFYLGRALEAKGEAGAAQRAYQEALRKDNQFSEVRLPLGELLARAKATDEAWVQFAKAVQLEPGNAEARRGKAALDPLITRKPEELIPVVKIAAARRVSAAPQREQAPRLRVAIGTAASGRPVSLKAVSVRCSGDFTFALKSGGGPLARGRAGEVWTLRRALRGPGFELLGPGSARKAGFNSALLIAPVDPAGDTLILDAVPSAQGYAWAALKDRELRETVEARPSGGGLALFNDVHLEDYLYGVVAEEMPLSWPLEALKVQAVVARTHALFVKSGSPHRRDGFDLCDGQHCQVYGGVGSEYARTREAVDATRGQVLRVGRGLAQTLYSSNCGGHTQSSVEAGWAPSAALTGVADTEPGVEFPHTPWGLEMWLRHETGAYCRDPKYTHPPEYRWARVVSAEALSARVNRHSPIGRLRVVRVLARGQSGHVHKVEFVGAQGSWTVTSESVIRRVLGLGPVRSTFFAVEAYLGADGRVSEFVLHGAGWGHAVGLCQSGAAGRAAAGMDYRKIVLHYYPAARLGALEAKERS